MTGPRRGPLSIDGVGLVPLGVFTDERGAVRHMLRESDPHFVRFGEIYFSYVHGGVTKAWKRHRTVTASYACVWGAVRFVLFDDRPGSPSRGAVDEVVIGPSAHHLLVVPPGVWNGFHGEGDAMSVVASCATEPYDPDEFARVPPHDASIPYVWPDAPPPRT